MLVFKAVKQSLSPDPELVRGMETFRDMVNDCLRIGLEASASSFAALKPLCYPRMLQYGMNTSYRTSAIFEAGRVLTKFETDSKSGTPGRPYCRKLFLTASLGVWVDAGKLNLPDGRTLELNDHTRSVLSQPGVRANSVTITPRNFGICYTREVKAIEPLGAVALDVNLNNVTAADTEGEVDIYDLSSSWSIHEKCRRVASRFRRHDRRVRGALVRKYGTLESNRREALLHNVSSQIVRKALQMRHAIAMEDLRGLKAVFGRAGGNTAGYLSMMNSWPFSRLRIQVHYKAVWEGLPVVWVDPQGTSNECSECGGGIAESPEMLPIVKCKVCGAELDRDLNAARIILRRGVRKLGLRSGPRGPGN